MSVAAGTIVTMTPTLIDDAIFWGLVAFGVIKIAEVVSTKQADESLLVDGASETQISEDAVYVNVDLSTRTGFENMFGWSYTPRIDSAIRGMSANVISVPDVKVKSMSMNGISAASAIKVAGANACLPLICAPNQQPEDFKINETVLLSLAVLEKLMQANLQLKLVEEGEDE